MNYIIIEVGSTTSKSYLYENNEIKEISRITIPFKSNYNINKTLLKIDKEKLYSYVNENKRDFNYNYGNKKYFTYVYGTSIFRNLSTNELYEFEKEFKDNTNLEFNVITEEIENKYTTYGSTRNINYDKPVAVLVTGGGSTELSIVENKKIIERYHYNFGAVDITNSFIDLKDDKVKSNFEEMINNIKEKLNKTKTKPEVLIISGNDHLYFYEQIEQKLEENTLFKDKNEPYMIDINKMKEIDKRFFYEMSLNKIKEKTKDEVWWNGARGMRLIVEAFSCLLEIKYIIPTKITCVYGIVEELNIML